MPITRQVDQMRHKRDRRSNKKFKKLISKKKPSQ